MKKVLFGLLVISILASCGKDKTTTTTTTTPQTTAQKLQYKWNLMSIQDIQYVGASTTIVDTVIDYGMVGDYVQFNTNNTAYYRIAGSLDTVAYNLFSDSKMVFDGDTFSINTLTATDLVMTYYGRETNPVNNWDNVLVLKK